MLDVGSWSWAKSVWKIVVLIRKAANLTLTGPDPTFTSISTLLAFNLWKMSSNQTQKLSTTERVIKSKWNTIWTFSVSFGKVWKVREGGFQLAREIKGRGKVSLDIRQWVVTFTFPWSILHLVLLLQCGRNRVWKIARLACRKGVFFVKFCIKLV